MKKYILVPDSFKGTMSSTEICQIMERTIRSIEADAEIHAIPIADGGEGTVDAFLTAVGGEKRIVLVKGPLFEETEAFYGVIDHGRTAILEMAACAGLPLIRDRRDPCRATTYGVGELICHALKHGCKKIILGLGGSATNDGGTGAAAALGVRFLDQNGCPFLPTGGTLLNIQAIDASHMLPELKNAEVIAMCDIDNPLCGPTGASAVFGPQKGATPKMVSLLDRGLSHLAALTARDFGKSLSDLPGAGAAGGMGFGAAAFWNAKLQMGIETVLDTVHFDDLLPGTDLVFSGEGRMDAQSLRGKVVIGVAKRTKKAGIPLAAVVGDIGDGIDAAYQMGVSGIFSINRVAIPRPEAKLRAKQDLADTMTNLIRFLHVLPAKP